MFVRRGRGIVQAAAFAALTALAARSQAQQLTNAPVDLRDLPPGDGLEGVHHRQLVGGSGTVRLLVRPGHRPTRASRCVLARGCRRARSNVLGRHSGDAVAAGGDRVHQARPPRPRARHGHAAWRSWPAGRCPTDPGADVVEPRRSDLHVHQQGARRHQVHPKIRLLNATRGGLGFAIIPSVILPTGDKKASWAKGRPSSSPPPSSTPSSGTWGASAPPSTAALASAASSSRLPRRRRPVRPAHRAWGSPTSTNQGIEVGNEFIGGFGLSYGVVPQKFDLVGELYGTSGLDANKLDADGTTSKLGPAGRGDRRHQALPRAQLVLRARRRLQVPSGLRLGGAARVPRLRLRAEDRRPRRRRHQGRRRQVPRRSGGLRRLRGRGRLPRSRQRSRRHPRRRRQVPERAGDQERLPGRGRLPRRARPRPRRRRHPRRRRQVPGRSRGQGRLRGRGRLPDPDNDKDGILDVDDLCPNDPEDKDGFEDEDGCPDPDNDKDRILDKDDKCPNEPETYNGFEDEDGCPDKGRVIVRKRQARDPRQDLLRDRQGDHQADLVPDPRRGRGDAQGQPADPADRDPGPRRRARRRRLQPASSPRTAPQSVKHAT